MLKVVVIEDEELVRRGIVMAVDWASVDCEVVGEASNGEAGLELIARERPDIVVTDIRMPRMDGLEMLRRLREEGCGASVILLTAYSDFTYAQSALKLGAVDYLLKPFHDGELEAAVQRISGRGREQPRPGDFAEISSKNRNVMQAIEYINANYNKIKNSAIRCCNRKCFTDRIFTCKVSLCHRICNQAYSLFPLIICLCQISSGMHFQFHIL